MSRRPLLSIRGERPERSARTSVSDAETARLAKALAHPARVAIMRHLLRQGECCCGDIVEVMPLAQATVSQHLKVLKDAGLVRGEIEGPRVCYCADPDAIERLARRLDELTGATRSRT
jgi:ArsR family transcriptional regulator